MIVFTLKAGTLYPLLHDLEQKELVTSYEKTADNAKVRKYYSFTKKVTIICMRKRRNGRYIPLP